MLLGIDIGGTSVKMGLLSPEGAVLKRHEAPVNYDRYQTPILDTVLRETKKFLESQGAAPDGIGVSATGQVDDRLGVVIGTNGKIANYEGSKIRETMEACFSVPVRVLNDANAAVLGENFTGRAKDLRNVVMVTLGTGVGGGVITDGQLLRGRRGIAGELGHFTLYADGVPCSCGKRGCFECYASTTALVAAAKKATGESRMNGRILFWRVQHGDSILSSVLTRWLDDVAAGITGLVHIFNPEIVLVGGGVSVQEKLLMVPLRTRVLAGIMPRFADGLRVEAAALGNDAGMVGAVKFFFDHKDE